MEQKYGALAPPGAFWQMGKSTATIHEVQTITNRLERYKKHCNDPYTYHPEEIDAIRELKEHAAEDIEFLLNEIMHS